MIIKHLGYDVSVIKFHQEDFDWVNRELDIQYKTVGISDTKLVFCWHDGRDVLSNSLKLKIHKMINIPHDHFVIGVVRNELAIPFIEKLLFYKRNKKINKILNDNE